MEMSTGTSPSGLSLVCLKGRLDIAGVQECRNDIHRSGILPPKECNALPVADRAAIFAQATASEAGEVYGRLSVADKSALAARLSVNDKAALLDRYVAAEAKASVTARASVAERAQAFERMTAEGR